MPNADVNLKDARSKPLLTGGHPGVAHGASPAAREAELQRVEGMKIAQTAVQSIGISTRDPWGPPISLPQYALAVSLIFTKATNQTIIVGTPPKHVLSTSILWNSLVHDKRFTQIPMSKAAPGDIIIGSGWQQGADGYAGIVVDHGRIVNNSSQGVQDNSSLVEIQRGHPGMVFFRYTGVPGHRSYPLANAGFDPNEPRLPAGQPGGGQWTSATQPDKTDSEVAGVQPPPVLQKPKAANILDNGTIVHRDGHHVSPVQTWKDKNGKAIFSKDVTDRLDEFRIGSDDIDHTNSSAHRSYNRRAQEITDQFLEDAKKAGIDPSTLTGEEAREFAEKLIRELEADGYLSKFNLMVKEGKGTSEALNAMRDAALAEGILKETGIGKVSQWMGEKAGVASEHLPGALKALGLAAAIMEFISEAKTKGLKAAARTQYYRFGDLLGQTPEEDQAMRQKASHWFYRMLGAKDDDKD